MSGWRPRLREAIDLRELPLGAEEGFVLSRLDGSTTVSDLRALTGLPETRVASILERLLELGVVQPPPPDLPHPTRSPVPPAAAPRGHAAPSSPVPPAAAREGHAAQTSPVPPAAAPTAHAAQTSPVPTAAGPATPASAQASPVPPSIAPLQSAAQASPVPPTVSLQRGADDGGEDGDEVVELRPEEAEGDAHDPEVPTTARALFGQHLRLLDEAERVSRAAEAKEPELSAFCFDPLPNVARALLGNPNFNLTHARMLARFHTAPPGLEALAARGGVARDPVVERCLLRNPRLPVAATRRLLAGQRLLKLWLLHQDREVPELARKTGKEVLRSRFGSAAAEERVDLIMRTEGRVLLSLGGIPVDGRTASLLCQRTYRSPLLILNLARWGACPPQVLVHLWKQPAVRHQLQLRQALLRHPNLPSEFKREAS